MGNGVDEILGTGVLVVTNGWICICVMHDVETKTTMPISNKTLNIFRRCIASEKFFKVFMDRLRLSIPTIQPPSPFPPKLT